MLTFLDFSLSPNSTTPLFLLFHPLLRCLLLQEIFLILVLPFWIWNSHWKLQMKMMIMGVLFHQGLTILGFKLQMKYPHLALRRNSTYWMVQNKMEKVCMPYILCHWAHSSLTLGYDSSSEAKFCHNIFRNY